MLNFKTPEESEAYKAKLTAENEGKVKLSILIASTVDRRSLLIHLTTEFYRQIETGGFKGPSSEVWDVHFPKLDSDGNQEIDKEGNPVYNAYSTSFKFPDAVEVIVEEDNYEMSIGAKRQKLLNQAKGKYIVYFDSDDMPKPSYVKDIMKALENEPDCVGFKIAMTTNADNPETCIHSLSNPEWKTEGKIHYRNCTHFNPVKRSLALQVGFEDVRYGEDKIYSDKISQLCKTEIFIDQFLFHYRYSNAIPHNQKYGIKK